MKSRYFKRAFRNLERKGKRFIKKLVLNRKFLDNIYKTKGLRRGFWKILKAIFNWWGKPFYCKFGLHKFSWENFGYDPKYSGQVIFYCIYCKERLSIVPVDDLPFMEQIKKIEFLRKINNG